MTFFQKTSLPNGLRVITESIPHVRSASIGVWVAAGSCWERPESMGITHFIEHMLFKGTERRTARQIAREIDGRGGNLNAFTSKEHTCFYAKVLDEHLPIAVDVLADMLQHSLLEPVEIEKEKGVVCEEIKMYEDVPDDVVHDLFTTAIWRGHPLGQPIVGTVETVQSFTRDQVRSFLLSSLTPDRIVVAAAGNLAHARVVDLVEAAFGDLPARDGTIGFPPRPTPPVGTRAILRVKETEQSHLVVGMRGLAQDADEVYSLHVLNAVLGGSTSSRLFQEIREQRGLAYSVYSYQSSFRNAGNFGVYAGVSAGAVSQVLALVLAAYRTLGQEGITAAELADVKEQLKGQIMLGLESTAGRMNRLGRGELSLGRVLSPAEILDRIDSVTLESVALLAHRLFIDEPLTLAAVGPKVDQLALSDFGFEEVGHG